MLHVAAMTRPDLTFEKAFKMVLGMEAAVKGTNSAPRFFVIKYQ